MSKLSDDIQDCGMRCNECKSISYKESVKAIEVVKRACVEAVDHTFDKSNYHEQDSYNAGIHDAIKAIQEVE